MSTLLTYTCCLPETGLVKNLTQADAADMERKGILCARDGNPGELATVHAQCPGRMYYPYTTLDASTGLEKCHCTAWDRPPVGLEAMGSPTEGECMRKCENTHAHIKISPTMPVDMVGGKCVAPSSDSPDYPSYLGGLETCCLVGDAEGYDADVWGQGSLCNRLFPEEKVWLQVPWNQGVQRLCKKERKSRVEAAHPGIKECSAAYAEWRDTPMTEPLPYCYVTEAEMGHHGPDVRQCWPGAEGVGQASPDCGGGSECGFMASCVPYPVMPGRGPQQTCHLAHGGKECRIGPDMMNEYFNKHNEQVGYYCGADGSVACCVRPANTTAASHLSSDTNSLECPAARTLDSCPVCPPPGSHNACHVAPPVIHEPCPAHPPCGTECREVDGHYGQTCVSDRGASCGSPPDAYGRCKYPCTAEVVNGKLICKHL